MLSMTIRHTLACVLMAVADTTAASESGAVLSCETRQRESVMMKQAPYGAHRVSKHVLEVTSSKGTRRFTDKPPHGNTGEMDGLHWRYCGYEVHAKAHLISMVDESAYSGEVLMEDTGLLVHAGHTVFFAPNKGAFLAIRQEAGVDGENWTIHDRSGKTRWSGYAGTTRKENDGDMVISTFEHPQWSGQGELTARFVCASSNTRGVVTLKQTNPGDWHWHGHVKCS